MSTVALRDAPITITTLERLITSPTTPDRYQTVADLLAAVLVGRELGVPEMTAINELYLVNGQGGISGKLMLALIFRAGHKVKFKLSPTLAEVETFRKTEEGWEDFGTYSFSIEDAVRAGLADKDNWTGYPQWMLAWRALAAAARFVYPDVVLGVGYTPEEIGFDVPVDALPAGFNVDEIVELVEVTDDIITEEQAADMLGATIVDEKFGPEPV